MSIKNVTSARVIIPVTKPPITPALAFIKGIYEGCIKVTFAAIRPDKF